MEIKSPFEYLTFNSVIDQFSPKQYSNHDGFKLRSLKGAVKALLLFTARTTQKSFFLNYTRGGNIAFKIFYFHDVKAYFGFLKSHIKQDESSVNLCIMVFF